MTKPWVTYFDPRADMVKCLNEMFRQRQLEHEKETLGATPMKEITIDGKKYRLVEDEVNFNEFNLRPAIGDDCLTLEYKGYRVMRFNLKGRFELFGCIPDDIGLDVDRDGKIEMA